MLFDISVQKKVEKVECTRRPRHPRKVQQQMLPDKFSSPGQSETYRSREKEEYRPKEQVEYYF